MAKLSEFMKKLLEKPIDDYSWRISAKYDNNENYRSGFDDCLGLVTRKIDRIRVELERIADDEYTRAWKGPGSYHDGVADAHYHTIGMLDEFIAEMQKHEY